MISNAFGAKGILIWANSQQFQITAKTNPCGEYSQNFNSGQIHISLTSIHLGIRDICASFQNANVEMVAFRTWGMLGYSYITPLLAVGGESPLYGSAQLNFSHISEVVVIHHVEVAQAPDGLSQLLALTGLFS